MSTIGYNSALAEQAYRPGLTLEAELSTVCSAFEGPDEDDVAFPVIERGESKRGENVKLRFQQINRSELPGTAFQSVLGNESQATEHEDNQDLRYFFFSRYVPNAVLEQNLVSFDVVSPHVSGMALQWAYLKEKSVINQLAGNTLVNTDTDYARSGGNIVTAQDADHIRYAPDSSGENTTDALVAADSTSVLDTRLIDDVITRMTSLDYVDWPVAPCRTPLGELYVMLCHGTGYQQIRENSSGSDLYDLSKAAIQGGLDLELSPLVTGEGFIYNKTLVLRSDFCPQGITSGAAQANTRVAVMFGARAGHWVYGEGYTDGNHLGYSEHIQHRRLSLLTDTIWGFKRTIVNSSSWGSFRIVHYSAV